MRLGFKRSLIIGLAVLVVLVVLAPAALAASPTGPVFVWGIVEGQYYGGVRELGNATVTVVNDADPSTVIASTHSNESGLFGTWADLALPTYADTYTVAASHDGFTEKSKAIVYAFALGPPVIGAVDPAVDLQLVVKNTTVSGKVKNSATTKGLAGVRLKLGNKAVKTNKNGNYSISVRMWPGSKIKITFSKKGFHTVTKTVTSNPGGSRTVNVALHT